uniref:UDP-N-acetylmuramoyl-L-alanyl-D-glutamate--2, 6-diaminopimelate ligase n=1 Tax=Vibrio sp. S9_S30 TaxID=2720226 RepID=UPI00188D910F|nr:UDP-N-acetylmuramoyl-L-alanyl-D-glutamate--2,6-diaminopimelate ligase [Vibrio sp. S9_S30]
MIRPWTDANIPEALNVRIAKLVLDSRKVQPGDVFIALSGHAINGHDFIPSAINGGAAAVLAQATEAHPHGSYEVQNGVLIFYLSDLPMILSALSLRAYGEIDVKLIGVTGTNGKTTITQIIAQWIELVGKKAAVMGTAGNGFLHAIKPAVNTTGSAIEVVETLSSLRQQGAEHAAIEVSSHGLIQGRVKALTFAVGVFTNLSRDHLDYHETMKSYADAKFTLFRDHDCRKAVINVDDSVGAQWIQRLDSPLAVSLESNPKTEKSLYATDVKYGAQGIELSFDGHWGIGKLSVPLIGAFNASNILLAFGSLLEMGFEKKALIESAPRLSPVIGRMEIFQRSGKAKVVVDYAHTPDALEKALSALRVHCEGKLWVIFGCGGDRDTGKRPMMAEIAERLADHTILTDDNPRSESPELIIKHILEGIKQPDKVVIKHDRFDACSYALRNASEHDIILLAGKGHEDYQVLADKTVYYSDRETAEQLLGIMG